MKIAKLPTGNVLKFPDHTLDHEIDEAVRIHLQEHTKKIQEKKEHEERSANEGNQRHSDIMGALLGLAQLSHDHLQKTHSLLEHGIRGHQELIKALNELTKAHKAKRRHTPVRDKNGRIISSESEVV